MRPLERRPGNDPGLPDCAAWVCPLHSARMDGLACPGTPIGSRRRNTGGSGRAELNRPSGGTGDPSAPPAKCPKDRHTWPPIYRLTMRRNPGGDPFARACRRYALHRGFVPAKTCSPISVTTCHIRILLYAPPGRTTDPEAMNFVPRRFLRGLGCR